MLETSPHTRGKLTHVFNFPLVPRNIPAYAGKALNFISNLLAFWKHPRIRGESPARSSGCHRNQETSPHTRGKLMASLSLSLSMGNIPAYAGKASVRKEKTRTSVKHPRIRGESLAAASSPEIMAETSPHTRGKLQSKSPGRGSIGNIPAYAGKAEPSGAWDAARQKHPRIRGESHNILNQ